MIFESAYRRQAFDKLQNEKEFTKKELKQNWEKKRELTKNPVVYAFASLLIWFSQH